MTLITILVVTEIAFELNWSYLTSAVVQLSINVEIEESPDFRVTVHFKC